jgi:hypothetical protein
MEPVARRVADISEGVAARLAGPLGWSPQGRTEIVLSDVSDDANGSGTAAAVGGGSAGCCAAGSAAAAAATQTIQSFNQYFKH